MATATRNNPSNRNQAGVARSGGQGRTSPRRAGRRKSDEIAGVELGPAAARRGREREPSKRATETRREEKPIEAASPRRQAQTRGERVRTAIEGAGAALRGAGGSVTASVTGNPVPAALIGAGLAWLLLGGRVRTAASSVASAAAESELMERARERFEDVSDRVSQRLRDAAGAVGEAFAERAHDVGEAVGDATGAVREGVSRLGEYAADGARAVGSGVATGATAVGGTVRRGYERSREGVTTAWHEHPLTSGLALLAAGVAVGMLLPGTVRENVLMGGASDAVARRAKTAARKVARRGRKVASSVAATLKKEVAGEGLAGEEVVRKMRRIAGHVQEATVNAAKQARLTPANVLSGEDDEENGPAR